MKIDRETLYKLYWEEKKSLREIAKIFNVNPTTVGRWMVKYDVPRRTPKNKRGGKCFKFKERVLSYIFGVLLGDAYIYAKRYERYAIELRQKRIKFAKSFENALKEIGLNPRTFKDPYHKGFWITIAYSKKFCEFYRSLNLEDIKKIVMRNKENMKEFIRGFYEAEGSNAKNEKQREWSIVIVNTNYDIILLVKEILRKLGFEFNLYTRKENKRKVYVLFSGKSEQNHRFIETIKPVIKNKIVIFPRKTWKWDKKEIERSLKNIYEEIGRIPTSELVPFTLRSAIFRHYKKWSTAIREIFDT